MNKTKILSLLSLCVVCLLCTIEACKQKVPETPEPPKEKGVIFSGSVWSKKDPVAEATIDVNGKEVKSGAKGEFEIRLDSAARYVLTIRKQGYGILSKVYFSPEKDRKYQLQQAYTVTVNAGNAISVRDLRSATNCSGTSLKDLDWGTDAYKKIPFVYNSDGKLIDFGWSSSSNLKDAFDYLSGTPSCNPGISLNIPANLIVDQNNNPVAGDVTISLTTIDVFSDDGMPGDYSFRDRNGTDAGYMVSLGAATIEIYSKEGQKYNLNPKAEKKAELTIPIEPVQQKFIKDFPEKIPLMYYDEKEGTWYQEGEAKLDKKTKSYVAQVAHFSTINMDYKMMDPACIKFRQNFTTGSAVTPFQLATVTTTGGLKYGTSQGNEAPNTCVFNAAKNTNLHLLYAVPKNSEVCIVLLDPNGTSSPADDVPYGISIHQTRNESYGANPPPTACPHPTCNSSASACFDATSSTCNDPDCTDVYSFSGGSCSYLALTRYDLNVIGTARKSGSGATVKWILKSAPASYPYTITQLDAGGNPVGATTTGTNTASPVQAATITTLDGSAVKVQIMIDDGSPAASELSAEIDILP